jgi:hypothetical protein
MHCHCLHNGLEIRGGQRQKQTKPAVLVEMAVGLGVASSVRRQTKAQAASLVMPRVQAATKEKKRGSVNSYIGIKRNKNAAADHLLCHEDSRCENAVERAHHAQRKQGQCGVIATPLLC